MVVKIDNAKKAEPLFCDWQESLIWSCLQNIMGSIYVDNLEKPLSAMAVLGDFCFFAGLPSKELVLYKPEECIHNFIIMVPQNDKWADLIVDGYGDKASKVTRYAMKKEQNVFDKEQNVFDKEQNIFDKEQTVYDKEQNIFGKEQKVYDKEQYVFNKEQNIFDKEKLQKVVHSLAPEYTLKMIEEDIFNQCRSNDWSRDLVSQYKDYDMYRRLGIGAVVLKDGIPVSGASAYLRYREGIEIEIDTKEEYRRKGLAYICGAKLILECLERELYPSWDAQNKWSVTLAEKLGYHFDHEYTAYEIRGY